MSDEDDSMVSSPSPPLYYSPQYSPRYSPDDVPYYPDEDMSETELREAHQRGAEEGDGWSHAFMYNKTNARGLVVSILPCSNPKFLPYFEKENWQKMGDSIVESCEALEKINLSHCNLNAGIMEAIFRTDTKDDYPRLKVLNLGDNSSLGIAGMTVFVPFLKSISRLKKLDLANTGVDNEGARLLAGALNYSVVEDLKLSSNAMISDEGVEYLLSASNSANLAELELQHTNIGRRGFEIISQFLRRDDTALKALSVTCTEGDHTQTLVDSISNKSKLEKLYIWAEYERARNDILAPTTAALRRLVCNLSSFDSLCESNHKLYCWEGTSGGMTTSDTTLNKALEINSQLDKGATEVQRLRCKLRTFYFQGDYDIKPFSTIDIKIIPHVLHLLTKRDVFISKSSTGVYNEVGRGRGRINGAYHEISNDNLCGIYRLIRNCHLPELFGFPYEDIRA